MRKLNSKDGRWQFFSEKCTMLAEGQLRDSNVKVGKRGGVKKIQQFTRADKKVLERLGVNTATPGKWKSVNPGSTVVPQSRRPTTNRGLPPAFTLGEEDPAAASSASAAPKFEKAKNQYMDKLKETEELMQRLKMGQGIPKEKRLPDKVVYYDRDGFALPEPPVGATVATTTNPVAISKTPVVVPVGSPSCPAEVRLLSNNRVTSCCFLICFMALRHQIKIN